jgi:hypothetical protein
MTTRSRWAGWIAGTFALASGEAADASPISREDALLQNRMAWVQMQTSESDCDAIFRSAAQRSRYSPSQRRAERESCRDAVSRQVVVRSGDARPLESEALVGRLPSD